MHKHNKCTKNNSRQALILFKRKRNIVIKRRIKSITTGESLHFDGLAIPINYCLTIFLGFRFAPIPIHTLNKNNMPTTDDLVMHGIGLNFH